MAKHGRHYKIGKSFDVPRRHREIAIELPEKLDVVHVIRTDDPSGVEAYWHKRFAAKRTNGEWFALAADDVRAFKRRRFM
jgi:Meiotically up-regulated gene 113